MAGSENYDGSSGTRPAPALRERSVSVKRVTWSLALVITNILGIAVAVAMIERQEIDALVLAPATVVLVLLVLWVKKQRAVGDHRR